MRVWLSIILLMMAIEGAMAGPLEEANAAYIRGDFVSAAHMYAELPSKEIPPLRWSLD